MYISESPRPATRARLLNHYGPRVITVARTSEVYGESCVVDPDAQRARFAAALADALSAGFSGLRIAADNTPLVSDDERLEAWIRWEHVADRFMDANPVTGLCAFDGQRVDVNRLRHLSTLHPLSAVAAAEPQFRMYSEAESLWLEGHIDSYTVDRIPVALKELPPGTRVLIDLSAATLMSRATITGLTRLAQAGVPVTVRGEREALDALAGDGLGYAPGLTLETTDPETLQEDGAPAGAVS